MTICRRIYSLTGSLNKNEKLINFWLGKRAQAGKKIPKRFNKKLKFYD